MAGRPRGSRRTGRKVGRPKGSGYGGAKGALDAVMIRLSSEAAQFIRAIARQNYRTFTAEVLMALEAHAKANGYAWPGQETAAIVRRK